jgi:hypothetical protein
MIIRNPVDDKIAKMQLLLAEIPAPVDLNNVVQRFHAYRSLYQVHLLAIAARNDIYDAYEGKRDVPPGRRGRPRYPGLGH